MTQGAIILATHNGADFLEDQITSIFRQTVQDWHLHITDDGSSDQTLAKIDHIRQQCPERITLHHGPAKGFAANFMSALRRLPPNTKWIAFADQDDIWQNDKLSMALHVLAHTHKPTIYCGRRYVVNRHLQKLGYDFPSPPTPSFGNALAQNIVAGNTMVMNNAALRLVQSAKDVAVPYHDWWIYLLVTGAGGDVIFDPKPSLLYRQHTQNMVGANIGFYGLCSRLNRLMNGTHAADLARFTKALYANKSLLNTASVRRFHAWNKHQHKTAWGKLREIHRMPAHRQSVMGQLTFCICDVMGLLKPPQNHSGSIYGSRKASLDL